MLRHGLAGLAAAVAFASPAMAADVSVDATENQFVPDEVTIAVGDTVTVSNDGPGFHNLRWQDQPAAAVAGGTTWSSPRTFTTAGSVDFLCEFHSGMAGTVTVQGAAPAGFTWTGGSGKWHDSAKWQPAGVPGVNDTAVLEAGAVAEVDDARQVGTLRMSGGATRKGPGTLTVTADLDTPGNALFTGTGVTIVQPSESFAANTIQLDRGHRMRFQGNLARTGGFFYIGDGNWAQPGDEAGVIEVGGTLTIPTLSGAAGVIGPTDGTGILRVLPTGSFAVPSGELATSAVPENQGTMNIQGKLVAYNGVNLTGGTTSLAGTITEGDVLMSGGRLIGGGAILDQALRISAGTVAPEDTMTLGGLVMTGGTLEVGLLSAATFDRLVTPSAILAGALVVKPAYSPASGDAFRIVQTSLGKPGGAFASVTSGFEATADAGGVLLKAVATGTGSGDQPPPPPPAPAATVTPAPTPVPEPPISTVTLPRFGTLVKLPKCAARRSVKVRLIAPAKSAKVRLGRKLLRTVQVGKAVTLKRLPRRAFTLVVEVRLSDGRTVKGGKRFRACKKA